MTLVFWVGMVFAVLAALGCGYQILAAILTWRFFAHSPCAPTSAEDVTVLKPLRGDEPRLEDNLATFLAQRHAGSKQLLCGVHSAGDAAAPRVKRLAERHPDARIDLAIGSSQQTVNAKVGNLLNMYPGALHDILVLSDSDIAVGQDYLATILAALQKTGVGAVTCFYRGRADAGLWSRFGAATTSYTALPGMVVGRVTGLASPCMGSTIALRRDTLDAIGGFARFADILADDHAIGAAVTEAGLTVEIPAMLVTHACVEPSLAALWRHQLRWAVTLRSLAPAGYAGSIIANPVPLALIAAAFYPALGFSLVVAAVVVRMATLCCVDRIADERSAPFWLLPAVDCFEFLVFLASFFARAVDWRGDRLSMAGDGRIAAQVGS